MVGNTTIFRVTYWPTDPTAGLKARSGSAWQQTNNQPRSMTACLIKIEGVPLSNVIQSTQKSGFTLNDADQGSHSMILCCCFFQDFEGSQGPLVYTAIERFPFEFSSLMDLATVLATEGSKRVSKICYVGSLSINNTSNDETRCRALAEIAMGGCDWLWFLGTRPRCAMKAVCRGANDPE